MKEKMLKPKVYTFLFLVNFLVFSSCILHAMPLYAQSGPMQEDLRALQKQVEALRDEQKEIVRQLREIKTLLKDRMASSIQSLPIRPGMPSSNQTANATISVANSPFKGEKTARLTIIEFLDYQCLFCARYFRETLPQIERDYINTGKVKYVVRDFPLEFIHKEALKAAEGAKCAGEQGKYWDMHDRLFADPQALGAKNLPLHAQTLGLDLPKFQQCLESGKQAAEVRKDIADGQKAGVRGTPMFFLGLTEPNEPNVKTLKVISGAQPYSSFKEAIDSLLDDQTR